MTTIKCLVVDDEPFAQKGLTEYVKEVPFLELIGICSNTMQAASAIQETGLLLLDINLPGLSGIDFLKSLKLASPLAVIFTTAYPEYAIEGYELDVIDYLVKPISFPRFLKAVNKANQFLSDQKTIALSGAKDYFFVKVNHGVEKVCYDDILFVEALQNYVAIHLISKKLICYLTLSYMLSQLPEDAFMRIHKSYIVALPKIHATEGYSVLIGTHRLPVSRLLKDSLMKRIGDKLIRR